MLKLRYEKEFDLKNCLGQTHKEVFEMYDNN